MDLIEDENSATQLAKICHSILNKLIMTEKFLVIAEDNRE
jgi:hypothetical protein